MIRIKISINSLSGVKWSNIEEVPKDYILSRQNPEFMKLIQKNMEDCKLKTYAMFNSHGKLLPVDEQEEIIFTREIVGPVANVSRSLALRMTIDDFCILEVGGSLQVPHSLSELDRATEFAEKKIYELMEEDFSKLKEMHEKYVESKYKAKK